MFHFRPNKSIFDSECEALVNPVNALGQSGKGLALQFRQRFLHADTLFKQAVNKSFVKVGQVHIVYNYVRPYEAIVYFPTKDDWRNPSQLEWIRDGLLDMRQLLSEVGVRSVAIPKLGCGLGGLNWEDVEPLIINTFEHSDFDRIEIYAEPTEHMKFKLWMDRGDVQRRA